MISVAERLWRRRRVTDAGCWEWTGATFTVTRGAGPYGKIGMGGRSGKQMLVHRVAYELLVGPIPEEEELDHLCRNTLCWRPTHLESVPHRVNLLRGEAPAAVNARKTVCLQGHPFVRRNRSGRRQCAEC